jgi:tRNA dimethylallyltransferase
VNINFAIFVSMNDFKDRYDLLAVAGHTAGGKTEFAVGLAAVLEGEILSADSRQVYRGMDLGTGKDLEAYRVGDRIIPYHLIDLVEPGYRYSLFEYQKDALDAYLQIRKRNHLPVLCGGSGLYLESVLRGYHLAEVPPDPEFREQLKGERHESLIRLLERYGPLHNTTDTSSRKRLIRAIEIARFTIEQKKQQTPFPKIKSFIIGIRYEREERRKRITERLKKMSYNRVNFSSYFWRTYSGTEIDYIEEMQGKRFAYEFKFKQSKAKIPKSWKEQYGSDFMVINNENYLVMIQMQ